MNIKSIEFETTKKDLTHLSGLVFFQKLIKSLGLERVIGQILPKNTRVRGQTNREKFFTGLYSFIAGAECIEDLEMFKHDPLFFELTNNPCSAVTMGRFLRSFSRKTVEKLQNELPRLAFRLREKLYSRNKALVLSMDATSHQQYSESMEGVEWCYKQFSALDSQNVFDQYGLCYGWHLRSGATHSSQGAVEMLSRIFNNLPRHNKQVYYRADSAYGTIDIYNYLILNKVNFAICLGENVWKSQLKKHGNKMKWRKTDLRFFDSNKCELSSCLYTRRELQGRSYLRIVFIRAWKKRRKPEDKEYYHHYAIVTNMSSSEMSDERVINFYRKRANVENQIKDLKNGMDFKHFPCQKLNANRAWGLIGIFAYNLMRYSAHKLFVNRGCFLKTVRRKMVFIASEIKRGQRKLKLRFTKHMFKEVNRLEMMITQLGFYRSVYRGQGPPKI